jgi:hypothetical protein
VQPAAAIVPGLVTTPKKFGAQTVQAETDADLGPAEVTPSGHNVQLETPPAEYWPAGQGSSGSTPPVQ